MTAIKRLAFPLCATALALVVTSSAQARDYGQQGAVWPVIEPDLLAADPCAAAARKSGETAKLNQELKRRTIARVGRPPRSPGWSASEVPCGAGASIRRSRSIPTSRTTRAEVIARGTRVNPLDTVPLRAAARFPRWR
jgi:conjugal transfer pilus assembly protein TraW